MAVVRRCLALVVALAFATTAAVVAAAPASAAAQAFSCQLLAADGANFGTGPPNTWNADLTVTANPAAPTSGGQVQVTIGAGSYLNGPINLPANEIFFTATVELSGGQTGSFEAKSAENTAALVANTEFAIPDMTGSFSASGSGAVDLKVTEIFITKKNDPVVNTRCTPSGGTPTQATVQVSAAAAAATTPTTTTPTTTTANTDLATTGPGDLGTNFLIGLLVFQAGLVVYVRSRRAATR